MLPLVTEFSLSLPEFSVSLPEFSVSLPEFSRFLKIFATVVATPLSTCLSSLKILGLRPLIFKLDKTLLFVFYTLHKYNIPISY